MAPILRRFGPTNRTSPLPARRRLAAVLGVLAVLGLAGCQTGAQASRNAAPTAQLATPAPTSDVSSPPVTPSATPAPISPTASSSGAMVPVAIKLFAFDPSPVTIPVGSTIVWTNQDAIIHSVTQRVVDSSDTGFDSDFFDEGQSFSLTFDQPGDFAYFCQRHTFMEGVVQVRSS